MRVGGVAVVSEKSKPVNLTPKHFKRIAVFWRRFGKVDTSVVYRN